MGAFPRPRAQMYPEGRSGLVIMKPERRGLGHWWRGLLMLALLVTFAAQLLTSGQP